jgi:hypothetical protein
MTHRIKGLPAAVAFSVARRCAIQVQRAFAKGELNDATVKARSLSLSVRYLQLEILGPMLSSRSNRQTSFYQTRAVAQIRIAIRHRRSIRLLHAALEVLRQRDSPVLLGLEHRPVASFRSNRPTKPLNNSRALLAPLLHLHIRLHSRQMEWALRDIPRKRVKWYHQKHYQHRHSTRLRIQGLVPALPPEERKAVQSLISSTCPTILCR